MRTTLFLLLFCIIASLSSGAQNGNQSIEQSFQSFKKMTDVSFFEVSDEMFKMLAEAKTTPPELKEYYRQLSCLRMIEFQGPRDAERQSLYEPFLSQTNLKDFSRLMVSERSDDKISFLRNKGKSGENEFLLVSNKAVIYVLGSIDLNSIHEFQMVLEVAGSAFGK